MMSEKPIDTVAETFGLAVEPTAGVAGNEPLFRIYKGANRVFTGNEQEVLNFFERYERERPPLFAETLNGYKE